MTEEKRELQWQNIEHNSLSRGRENIYPSNMPNIAYPGQHNDIDIPHGSRDHVIIPDAIKITFNLDNESIDKARSVVNNVSRALVKKKLLMLGSTDIDTTQIFTTPARTFT